MIKLGISSKLGTEERGEASLFKYCPFCGQKLVLPTRSVVFKYCPECGLKLEADSISAKQEDIRPDEMKCEEEQKNMQIAVADQKDIGIAAEEFFTKLKGKLSKPKAPLAVSYEVSEDSQNESCYYSIILKSCENKEKLAHALKKVFARSFLAIRMAIDNMPGILVYKGKVSDMTPVVTALSSQNAVFSIVPGNFNFKTSLAGVFPDFNSLFPEVQNLIKAMPLNMWLGDDILGVYPEVYQDSLGPDSKGALVISDQALYFVYQKKNQPEYGVHVIPYSTVEQLFLDEGCEYDGLVVGFKGGRDEEMFVISDELILSECFEIGRKAMENQQNSVMIKASCPQCGQEEYHTPYDLEAAKQCSHCALQFEMSLG